MNFPRLNRTTGLYSLLMASSAVCAITVDGDGVVTGSQPPMTVAAGGEVTAQGAPVEVSGVDAPADPDAPAETPEAAAARVAKERANESPEDKTAREAEEALAAAEETRRAALTDEERAAEDTAKEAAKVTEEEAAKNKAWDERDKSKDVAVSPEQKAHIAKLTKTPEQVAAMEEFTLETNTTNDLSPASRAKAAALWNVTPEMVDNYVASVISANKGVAENTLQYDDAGEDPAKWSPAMTNEFNARMDALYAVAGSKENWDSFSEWAQNGGLDAPKMQALQAAISANPIVGATVAEKMMAGWRAEGNGGGPVDLSRGAGVGARPAVSGVKPFASKAEQNAAINDPKYAKDEAYRQSVDARMVASTFKAGAMM